MTMVGGQIVFDGGMILAANLQEPIRDVNLAGQALFRRRTTYLAAHKPFNELELKKDRPLD